MRPLALGSDPAIAYIFNTGTQANPSFAELKWYDVANGNKTVITHLSNEYITRAQVSTDGQWILFVTDYPQYDALQLVRMDGQGLQTLYCTTREAIQGVQWSPDQSRVIFSVRSISGLLNLYLLNMANGQVQPELVLPNNANTGFLARTWANNSLVYVAGVPMSQQGPASEKGLYLLNTRNGPNQSPGELETVIVPSSSTVGISIATSTKPRWRQVSVTGASPIAISAPAFYRGRVPLPGERLSASSCIPSIRMTLVPSHRCAFSDTLALACCSPSTVKA
jgi:dipeptidyl aminopeptidase/acylaminoacyl peptidase